MTASSKTTPTVAVGVGLHNTTDVEFASTLSQLAGQGQAIAALAQNRADHPALPALATEVQGRAHDIDTMHAWQQDWGQHAPATTATGPGMLSSDDIQALSAQHGGAFDDAWLEHMTGNYTAAIAWCQRELKQGVNPQARDLATRWLTAMNHELGSVQQWHTEWGHHPNPAPTSRPAQPAPPTTTSTGPPAGTAHPDDNQHMTPTTQPQQPPHTTDNQHMTATTHPQQSAHPNDAQHMTPTTHPQQPPHTTDGLHANESQHMDSSGHMDNSHG